MQQEETLTVLDACVRVEARIHEVRQKLLDARPESLDRCESELSQIVAMLEGLVAGGELARNPPVSSALMRIRRSAHALSLQVEYASNLCLGWIQLRLGAGYSADGLPVLVTGDPGSSFEA
jgi:hypothetical protein